MSLFQSQAKSIAEQKRFPFATDNESTNEELGETWLGDFSWDICLEFMIRCRVGRQGGEAERTQSLALPAWAVWSWVGHSAFVRVWYLLCHKIKGLDGISVSMEINYGMSSNELLASIKRLFVYCHQIWTT